MLSCAVGTTFGGGGVSSSFSPLARIIALALALAWIQDLSLTLVVCFVCHGTPPNRASGGSVAGVQTIQEVTYCEIIPYRFGNHKMKILSAHSLQHTPAAFCLFRTSYI